MTDPTKYLRIGGKTAIDAAMTTNSKTCPVRTNPKHGQALPYIHQALSFVNPRHTTTAQGTTTFITYNVYADDPSELDDLVVITLGALTNINSPISVDSSVKLITYDIDENGINGTFENDTPDGIQYMKAIRIKYRTHE